MIQQYTYIWQGTTRQGKQLSGEISAPSLNLAKFYLQKRQISFIYIKRKRKSWRIQSEHLHAADIILFYRQVATLVLAGISLHQALIFLTQHPDNIKTLPLLNSLKNDINAGKSFTDSLRKFPHLFDSVTCSLIEAGEKSGTLDIMLERIATYKESAAELKNKICSALFYPAIIFAVALIVSFVMLIFIVPRFAELFASMHSKLPAFTLLFIHLSNFLRRFGGWLFLLCCAMGSALYFFKRSTRTKLFFDGCLLKLPFLGTRLQKFLLARFSRSLAIIFAAGIPITDALSILMPATGNLLYTNALKTLHLDISTGKPLHHGMQNKPLFPVMMRQMIQVGEESGTLEKMLHKIADFYEADIELFITKLSKSLEPLIMIILGVLIGGLVIAMYLPIFKLGTVI